MLGPKKIWGLEKFWLGKTFGQKIIGSKQNLGDRKNFVKRKSNTEEICYL